MSEQIIPQSEVDELCRLEVRQSISDLLYLHESLFNCDRTLMRWLSGIMIRADGAEQAIVAWRNIINRGGRNETSFSKLQLKQINISDDEITQLYFSIQALLCRISANLNVEIVDRVTHQYGHQWNDAYEQRQKPKRSLEVLSDKGIVINIPSEHVDQIRKNFVEGAECPILDKVKNMRIVTINGFEGSKMSLTIHDIFDHFWFYSRLKKLGVLDRYSSFLKKVGNPQSTDIFKREGELIASISFDYRGYTVSETTFQPLFSIKQIKKILQKSIQGENASDNQLKALELLEDMEEGSNKSKGLCFILSGLSIELMEQRRKHGFIRTIDSNGYFDGILGILDPEYVALVIEGNSILFDPKEGANEVLLNISVMVEDYLIKLSKGEATTNLVIRIDDLEIFDPYNTYLSLERIKWIKGNIGFAANRRDQC